MLRFYCSTLTASALSLPVLTAAPACSPAKRCPDRLAFRQDGLFLRGYYALQKRETGRGWCSRPGTSGHQRHVVHRECLIFALGSPRCCPSKDQVRLQSLLPALLLGRTHVERAENPRHLRPGTRALPPFGGSDESAVNLVLERRDVAPTDGAEA
jgi:hypothetical protein